MRIFCSIVFVLLSLVCTAQNIPAFTRVPVRLTSRVTSNGGGTPSAIVDADVYVNDNLVIARGTIADLMVQRKETRMGGKPGQILLEVTGTTSVDGKHVVLTGEFQAKGQSRRPLSLGVGLGLGLFFWPCLYCLAIEGEDAEIVPGTIIHNAMVAYPVQ